MKYEVRVCEKQYVYITVDADSMADAKNILLTTTP